jgi:hypothetical protein
MRKEGNSFGVIDVKDMNASMAMPKGSPSIAGQLMTQIFSRPCRMPI